MANPVGIARRSRGARVTSSSTAAGGSTPAAGALIAAGSGMSASRSGRTRRIGTFTISTGTSGLGAGGELPASARGARSVLVASGPPFLAMLGAGLLSALLLDTEVAQRLPPRQADLPGRVDLQALHH